MGALLSFIPIVGKAFTTVDTITRAISNEKIVAINAATEQQRIQSQERVRALEAQRDYLMQQSQYRGHRIVQFCLGMFVLVPYAFVCITWDKILCKRFVSAAIVDSYCSTDDLSDKLWQVFLAILGSYTITAATGIIGGIFKR